MSSTVDEDLLVEEYKSCRDLIGRNIDFIEKNEVYSLGAAAAIAVFSLQSSIKSVAIASAWMPILIAVIASIRFWGLDRTIDLTNSYLMEIEFKHPPIKWTQYYKEKNVETGKILKKSRQIFWVAFLTACIAFGILMTWLAPLAIKCDN